MAVDAGAGDGTRLSRVELFTGVEELVQPRIFGIRCGSANPASAAQSNSGPVPDGKRSDACALQ